MKTEIDGHLYAAGRAMIDVSGLAASLANDLMAELLDTPDARQYCREGLDQIDLHVATARSRLNLYAAGQADRDAALDGAAEGVRRAVGL